MTDNIETQIRMALDAQAHEVEVPSELATRTLGLAEAQKTQPLLDRLGSLRDARATRRVVSSGGFPRWMAIGMAGATAVTLFVLGSVVVNGWRPLEGRFQATSGAEKTLDFEEGYNYRSEPDAPAAVDDTSGSGDAVAGVVSSGDTSADKIETGEGFAIHAGDADGDDAGALANASRDSNATTGNSEFNEPQLVRAAEIEIAVENFEDAWGEANEVATNHQGHVIDSQTSQVAEEIAQGTIVMRVPTTELEDVLKDLRGLGTLARLDTSGNDISAKIATVEEQIADAKEEEKELTELLNRAGTLSEQSDIRNRREEVRKHLENLQEKTATYEEQVATSIVRATVREDEVAAGSGGSIVGNAVETAGHLFLTITAGMLVLLGALGPIAILTAAIWFALRTLRRRRTPS